ncbi:MAG TPA: hypothetical protein VF648_07125 [Pyrinomonadaceae bacterium]|jgi:hypothetical protein
MKRRKLTTEELEISAQEFQRKIDERRATRELTRQQEPTPEQVADAIAFIKENFTTAELKTINQKF